jgi:hypothetical protein
MEHPYADGFSVAITSDGGYIVLGGSRYFRPWGDSKLWLIKTDSSGNHVWNKTVGRPGEHMDASLAITSDGGYIILGSTYFYGAGSSDVWLIKN